MISMLTFREHSGASVKKLATIIEIAVRGLDSRLMDACQNNTKAEYIGLILIIGSFIAAFIVAYLFHKSIIFTLLSGVCTIALIIGVGILFYVHRCENRAEIMRAHEYSAVSDCLDRVKNWYGITNDIQINVCKEEWTAKIGFKVGDVLINILRYLRKKPLRYTLIISRDIASWPPLKIETVLGHELSHILHKDSQTILSLRFMALIDVIGMTMVAFAIITFGLDYIRANMQTAIGIFLLVLLLVMITMWRRLRRIYQKIESRCDFDAILITRSPDIYNEALRELYKRKKVNMIKKLGRKLLGGSHPNIEDRVSNIEWIKAHIINRNDGIAQQTHTKD